MGSRELLAWNLRALRTARGLSQERLAADAGLARSWVSKIELKKSSPTLDLVDRLAAALEVEPTALLAKPAPGAPEPMPLPNGRKAGDRRR